MPLSQMLFSINGRITRTQFWLYSIGKFIAFLIFIATLGSIFKTSIPAEIEAKPDIPVVFFIAIGITYIAFLWMSVCVSTKRCHDRDKSGWFMLVSLIPLVGLWYLVEAGFLDGTQGPNRFGPSPKGIGESQISDAFS